jgi:sigma-54 dependent transcriptional regulator, acetoin dehydrogenase operon transcriptional activator AcoR
MVVSGNGLEESQHMTQDLSHRQKIADSRKHFIATGEIDTSVVRKEVADSWKRSKTFGIDPNRSGIPVKLAEEEVTRRVSRREDLIRVATPFLKTIFHVMKSLRIIIMILDEECMILDAIGGGPLWEANVKHNATVGHSFHEKMVGTTAPGIVMNTGAPIQLFPEELYSFFEHELIYSATPLYDADHHFIGILYVSVLSETALKNPHIYGMMIAAAKAIENQLSLMRESEKVALLNKYLQATIDQMPRGVLVFDKAGKLVYINRVARKILDFQSARTDGVSIQDVTRFPSLKSLWESEDLFIRKELMLGEGRRSGRYYVTVERVSDGHGNYVGKAFSMEEMRKVKRLISRMIGATARYHFKDILGDSPAMKQAISLGENASQSNANVLLLGESGTGKELMAHAIHNAGPRKNGPFVAINCAALPFDLIESELFGYEEGTFTGASRHGRPGKFELAESGTIFLDEIDRLALEMQAKLLRVLEDRRVVRLGGNEYIQVDVRIIAASKASLETAVLDGRFRPDLYYRLNVLPIILPALRHRREDIPLLSVHFALEKGRALGKTIKGIDEMVLVLLQSMDWPGNVRQLENFIDRAVHKTSQEFITPEDMMSLDTELASLRNSPEKAKQPLLSPSSKLQDVEKESIRIAIQNAGGNFTKAARALGISRDTLYRKIKKYRIERLS